MSNETYAEVIQRRAREQGVTRIIDGLAEHGVEGVTPVIDGDNVTGAYERAGHVVVFNGQGVAIYGESDWEEGEEALASLSFDDSDAEPVEIVLGAIRTLNL